MNDRYLFKAKRKNWRELPKEEWWVRGGSLITFMDDGVKSYYMPQFNEKCVCEHDEITDDILAFSNCRFYKIDESTLCQCTGSKDKNGTPIWENDVCIYDDRIKCVVKFGEYSGFEGKRHIGFSVK